VDIGDSAGVQVLQKIPTVWNGLTLLRGPKGFASVVDDLEISLRTPEEFVLLSAQFSLTFVGAECNCRLTPDNDESSKKKMG
jgi:hypothetical protein